MPRSWFHRSAAAAALLSALAPGRSDARCALSAQLSARIGDGASVAADLDVNVAGGRLTLGESVRVPDGWRTAADRVRIGSGSSVGALDVATLLASPGADVRGPMGSPALPLRDPYCVAQSSPCGTTAVEVPAGSSAALGAGSYGAVRLGRDATLVLPAGAYSACSLELAPGARIVAGEAGAVAIEVAGRVRIGRDAAIAGDCAAARISLHVAGTRVRLGRRARLDASLSAPAARVRTGSDVALHAGACARSLVLGARSNAACLSGRSAWHFTEVTRSAGLGHTVDYSDAPQAEQPESTRTAGGVAAGDYDGDGLVDLFIVRGIAGADLLMRNRGDGTFEDVAAAAGLAGSPSALAQAPAFADLDGDGHLDLLLGGILGTAPKVYRNRGDATFEDVTAATGFATNAPTFSASFADIDGDDDLDAFLAHWVQSWEQGSPRLWRNDGSAHFTDITEEAGIGSAQAPYPFDLSFTANFADTDDDGDPDLLVAADVETSQVFRNDGGAFTNVTQPVISDENGMGASIGDYDNDGDLDWFVTSIWDPNGVAEEAWGVTGNRLYRNKGDGRFEDATEEAGVREGYWGWASCFADFDLDGHLDIFHVNGWTGTPAVEFFEDPSVLFIANGDGTFAENAAALGILDDGQGRGLVCFDYDNDGDLDIFVANAEGQSSRLLRNDGIEGHWLSVALAQAGLNTQAIGARVTAVTGAGTQIREIRAGSNYLSQDPAVAHFGLGCAAEIDELHIRWPDGTEQTLTEVAPDQALVINRPPE